MSNQKPIIILPDSSFVVNGHVSFQDEEATVITDPKFFVMFRNVIDDVQRKKSNE